MRRLILLLVLLGVAGCAPRLSPPYRDYEVRTESDAALTERLTEAATEAGWTIVAPTAAGMVTTASRPIDDGLTSRTEAALDLVPIDGGFVRVHVRAERRSFLGGRTKVYALSAGLREAILGPLTAALSERGLVALGTPRDRDEDATE